MNELLLVWAPVSLFPAWVGRVSSRMVVAVVVDGSAPAAASILASSTASDPMPWVAGPTPVL